MKKSLIVAIIAGLLAVGCYIGYKTSPNYVAEDGMLVEAFGFIPLFYICMLVGGAALGRYLFGRFSKKG